MPPKSPLKGTRGTPAEEPKQDDGSERELMEKELVIAYMKSKLGRCVARHRSWLAFVGTAWGTCLRHHT